MSASGLPYRLRPNKYVDREMFAEFVSLLVSSSRTERYIYISMGGKHLSDHHSIYRRSGIRKLYSFDIDSDTVERQKFNTPFDGVVCMTHSSKELPTNLDKVMSDFAVENAIIWLDFTEPKRLSQLGEVEELAKKLVPGDVIRVTMNADFSYLRKREANLTQAERDLPEPERRVALLRQDLGSYLPRSVQSVDFIGMAGALAKAVARAIEVGAEAGVGAVPKPVLLTRYQDTTPMLSVTALMTDRDGAPAAPEAWTYFPSDWGSIEQIVAPDLSPRERYALDKVMHRDAGAVTTSFGFSLSGEAIEAYARFHRFYPLFHAVGD